MSKYTLTKEQYQELYLEVMTFADIGGLLDGGDVIWNICIEEMKELQDATEDLNPADIQDAIADTFVTLTQLYHFYFKEPCHTFDEATVFDFYTIQNCIDGMEEKDERYVKSILSFWQQQATLEARRWGVNLYKAIKFVNKSNFTKYPQYFDVEWVYGDSQTLLKAADECMALAKQYGKDYPNVVATVNTVHGVDYVVFRQDHGKGKVVKHFKFFKEPDFTGTL